MTNCNIIYTFSFLLILAPVHITASLIFFWFKCIFKLGTGCKFLGTTIKFIFKKKTIKVKYNISPAFMIKTASAYHGTFGPPLPFHR